MVAALSAWRSRRAVAFATNETETISHFADSSEGYDLSGPVRDVTAGHRSGRIPPIAYRVDQARYSRTLVMEPA